MSHNCWKLIKEKITYCVAAYFLFDKLPTVGRKKGESMFFAFSLGEFSLFSKVNCHKEVF